MCCFLVAFTPPYGSGTKPRMGVRGYSKRGRPRGSRSRSLGSYPRPVSGQFNNSQSTGMYKNNTKYFRSSLGVKTLLDPG